MFAACILFYTASIAFYIWTKEIFIKQYVAYARRMYIVRNSDVKYHWTDYAAMLYPLANLSFAIVNLVHALIYKYKGWKVEKDGFSFKHAIGRNHGKPMRWR